MTAVASAPAVPAPTRREPEPAPVQRKPARPGGRKRRRRADSVIAIILLLIGVMVLTYPVFATFVSNYSQQMVDLRTRERLAQEITPADEEAMLAQAEEYNTQLHSGPILDPFLQRVAPDTKMYRDYLALLDYGSSVMGSVEIPSIHVHLPIYHGTDDATLDKGAGHLFGTSLPVGGEGTHAVITAHSGLAGATMFDKLPDLKIGDSIYVRSGHRLLRYTVHDTEVVVPTNTESLNVVPGRDLVTLITCTPYGVNTHRLLVHAERAPLDPDAPQPVEGIDWLGVVRPWMVVPLLIDVWAIRQISREIRRLLPDGGGRGVRHAGRGRQARRPGRIR